MRVKIISKPEMLDAFLKDKSRRIAEAMAFQGEADIKKKFTQFVRAPIQTGNLRRSINAQKEDDYHWTISADTTRLGQKGVDIQYAYYIEYGLGTSRKYGPRAFMRLGIEDMSKKVKDIATREAVKITFV